MYHHDGAHPVHAAVCNKYQGTASVLLKTIFHVYFMLYQVAADAKSYILRSQLPADVYKAFVEDENRSHVNALTFVVTSIVRLAGGKINEENLWHHLRRLGLSETDESHPVYGNLKLALEAIVQQRYLHKERVNGPEGNATFYELAERSLDGPINDGMKEHIAKIVNKDITSVDAD
uniref:MAGE domain-containing protein n=1 Tax=Solanum lycopersicum TaxID=4081 RepID=A0A3Q7ID03_SOLLC